MSHHTVRAITTLSVALQAALHVVASRCFQRCCDALHAAVPAAIDTTAAHTAADCTANHTAVDNTVRCAWTGHMGRMRICLCGCLGGTLECRGAALVPPTT